MAVKEIIEGPLNEQQLLMLRLLKTPMPDADFDKMRRLAVDLLAKQLDEIIGDWEDKNNITAQDYEKMVNGHFRASR